MKTNTFNTVISAFILCGFLSCKQNDPVIPVIKPSDGSKMTINGGEGGANAANAVYIDLSTDKQSGINRSDWSLGFFSGSEFRVILNNQVGMSAMVTSQTNINAVNSSNFDINELANDTKPEKLKIFDGTNGDLNSTVIQEIKAADADNKVYVVNIEFGAVKKENVWKVRVLRANNTSYTLQYAKIDDSSFKTATITKDNAFNFKFFSFTNGPVQVEPKKDEWDIVWSRSIFFTNMGPSVQVPYAFSDLIFLNHLDGVSAEEVIFLGADGKSNGKPTYEEFNESKLSTISFQGSRNVISSNWRSTVGTGALKDRYYVLKDKIGNVYKIKFIAMGAGNDGGKRGFPEFEYKLVKGK